MDVLMPQLGETVAEGKIVKWFKSAGDAVKPGENLFEIETDKTSMEVPAIAAGTLTDIRFQVGEVAKVGAVVAVIAGAGGAAQSAAASAPAGASQAPFAPAQAGAQSQSAQSRKELGPRLRGDEREDHRSFAYPHMDPWREVRTPERNHGPARIGGRQVTPLARRLASERGIDLNRVTGSGPHGRIVAVDIGTAPQAGATAAAAAQFYLVADVEIGRLLVMRDEAKAAGAEFSLGDFAVKAWAVVLKRAMPSTTDIGLMETIDGRRVTKTIRGAAGKTLTAIAREAAGQDGSPFAGVTSAVAVAAASGIREFTTVLAPPLTSVLGVGAPRRAPIEKDDGGIKFIGLMTVTLSCDHRAVDAALAADLLMAFKALVENPVAALV